MDKCFLLSSSYAIDLCPGLGPYGFVRTLFGLRMLDIFLNNYHCKVLIKVIEHSD